MYEQVNVFLSFLNIVLFIALIVSLTSLMPRKPAAASDEESGASESMLSDNLVAAMEDDFRRGGF